jgi:hypothetical protein
MTRCLDGGSPTRGGKKIARKKADSFVFAADGEGPSLIMIGTRSVTTRLADLTYYDLPFNFICYRRHLS